MKKIAKKGFTLIELMVVMAIIGGLSTMAFIYLQGARDKGSDTAIRSVLTGLMSLAEVYYSNNSDSYAGSPTFCAVFTNLSCAGYVGVNAKICESGLRIRKDNGSLAPGCSNDSGTWAANSQLKSDSTVRWCVDYNLANKKSTGIAATTPFVCL